MKYHVSALVICFAALAALAAQRVSAQVVLNETFTDGDLNVGSDANDGKWLRQNGNTQTVGIVSDSTIGGGNALAHTNQTNGTLFVGSMQSAADLGPSIGNRIDESFDFRFTQLPSSPSASFFRFGIFKHSGAAPTDGGTETNPDSGYIADLGAGGSSGLVSIGEESAGSDGLGGGLGASGLASSTQIIPVDVNNTDKHHLLFQITRTATGVSLAAFFDGQLAVTATDDLSPFTSFDEVAFRLTGGPATVNYDNVVVQMVPEPSSLLLAIFPLLAIGRGRRQRSSPVASV